jgi:hypothetical protein
MLLVDPASFEVSEAAARPSADEGGGGGGLPIAAALALLTLLPLAVARLRRKRRGSVPVSHRHSGGLSP